MEPPVNRPANPCVGLNKKGVKPKERVPILGRCFRLIHLGVLVASRFEIAGPGFRLTSSGTGAGEPRQPKVAQMGGNAL